MHSDSQEALHRFAQVDPSYYGLVILDIRILSALDVAEEMVSILPDVKLDDVIRKPVEQDQFLNKLKAVL